MENKDDRLTILRKQLLRWSKNTCKPVVNSEYEIVSEIAAIHGHSFADDHKYIFVGTTNVCPPDTKQHVPIELVLDQSSDTDGNIDEFYIFDSQTFWKDDDVFSRKGPIRLYLQINELFYVSPVI